MILSLGRRGAGLAAFLMHTLINASALARKLVFREGVGSEDSLPDGVFKRGISRIASR